MTFEQLCKTYGNANRAAKALSISRQTIQNWKTRGRIPFQAQYVIQIKTKGKLKADASGLIK